MKLLLSLAVLFTTNAFAMNICSLRETSDFYAVAKRQGIRPYHVRDNYYTPVEKQLIHRTVKLQSWRRELTQREALVEFMDAHYSQKGSLAGNIEYYMINGRNVVLVHYYPGDNEYGAFYEYKNGNFNIFAEIGDSFISCKR